MRIIRELFFMKMIFTRQLFRVNSSFLRSYYNSYKLLYGEYYYDSCIDRSSYNRAFMHITERYSFIGNNNIQSSL